MNKPQFKVGDEVLYKGKRTTVLVMAWAGNRFVGYSVGDRSDPLNTTRVKESELTRAGKTVFVATVIDQGETCDGHARKLAQGTEADCKRAIRQDKKDFARGLMDSTREEDAVTEDDFDVKPNEIWYAPDGKNDFTNGRMYDVLAVELAA